MTQGRPGVVVTGLGTIAAVGGGREALAEQLLRSEPRWAEVVGASTGPNGASRQASLIELPNFLPWLSPRAARRMSRPSRLAVVAAKLALEDASLGSGELGCGAPVGLATSFGPMDFSERIVKTIYEDGPEATSPALFTESVANAPSAQVALMLKALGPNIMVTQREAGPLIALGTVAREIASGRAQIGIAGSVDEVNPLLHSVLASFGALADPEAPEGFEVARPFDRSRTGFQLAESAGVVVLEREDRAIERGARPLARVRLSLSGFDAAAPVAGWSSDPTVLSRRLSDGLERAGIDLDSIDRVVSGASGSRSGDRLEGGVLRALWPGSDVPPVLAPKGVVGEYGGGHLAAAILAAHGEPFGPTGGFSEVDPEIGIEPHDGRELPPPRRLLVTSLAAGGAAAWTVLEAVDS